MATLKIKIKLKAMNRENHVESLRSNQSRDTNLPMIQEDYITQVSEEIKGEKTKKFS